MSERSTSAYQWIDDKTNRLSRWLDENRLRIVIALSAASVSWYGQQMPDGAFVRSISPELFGIVITAVIIDYINERRQENERRTILIAQLGSRRRDVSELAIIELRNRGWLYNGSLSGAVLVRPDLSEAYLKGADLSGVIFLKSNLSGAYLRDANLSGAYLLRANLSRAIMRGTNLSGANLLRADMNRATLRNANLNEADLREADLSGAYLPEADLRGALLSKANLRGATLSKAKLCRASLRGANMSGDILLEADLGEVDLQRANLSGSILRGANLSKANMRGTDLSGAVLMESDMSGVDLRQANLSGALCWTIKQLNQAKTLGGAILPDGVQLGIWKPDQVNKYLDGPTFEEWKSQYLAEHGDTVTDERDSRQIV